MTLTTEDRLWYKSWPTNVKKEIEMPNISIQQRFHEVVKKKSNDTLITLLSLSYSYADVDELSDKFARYLLNLGIKQGDKVGLLMPNIPQFVISFFGILKMGGVVVPMNPLFGTEDLNYIVNNSEVKIIVALDLFYANLSSFRESCPNLQKVIVTSIGELLSTPKRIIAQLIKKIHKSPPLINEDAYFLKSIQNLDRFTSFEKISINVMEDLAVLAYSGGTTGKSKGIMLTHYNIMSNLAQAREWASQVGDEHRFIGAVPFFHLIGLTTVFLATIHFEGSVALVPNPRDFDALLKTINDQKPTYFHGVPTLFRALLNHKNLTKYDLSSLKIVFSGSAPLSPSLAENFVTKATHGNAIMVEAFGMTELSPMASANPMERGKLRYGSIGIPIVSTDMKIINPETSEDLPQGDTGEIVVKGPQIMKGYWKNPDETAKIITEDGYLRTGDLGYMDSEGYFYIVDRIKDMINASGYKISPSEVENYLLDHPSIAEVAVIGFPDEYRGETPKAYIVLHEGAKILTEQDVKDFCEGKIANYKIPTHVEIKKELPKTTIGKVDRKVLRHLTNY